MQSKLVFSVFLLSAVLSTSVLSAQAQNSTQRNFTLIEETQTELTEEEKLKKRADMFGLTLKEWQRFQEIMQGPQGKKNPDIDPVMALGIYARNDVERQRFAELAVQNDYQHFGQMLAFQRSYNQAQKRLYGHLEVIPGNPQDRKEPKKINNYEGGARPGDRLMYFTSLGCHTCEKDIPQLINYIEKRPGVGLDVYVIGTGKEDKKVQQWAKLQNIPVGLVRARVVTLNHDNGTLLQLDNTRSAPTVILRRGNEFKGFDAALNR